MSYLEPRAKGLVLVFLSATVFSTAGLFTKGITADSWTIVFWRGVFAALVTLVFIIARGAFRREFLKMGWSGWAVVATYVTGTPAYIAAFKLTTIANVSLIYAAAPFVTAGFAWILINERPTKTVVLAALMALGGVGIIVGDSIGQVNLQGDLLTLWMTVCMAVMMIIYRRYPNTPAAGPSVLGSIFLLPIAAYFSDPFAAQLSEIPYMVAFGLVFALASITLAAGSRYLPAAQTALFSAMDAPLAPIWAYLIMAEVPTARTIIGGSIIMIAVIANSKIQSRKPRTRLVCETASVP
ncbi:MAG: EamA family transporter [Rhodospirillales bacterium]|jgi:drug/metabolite transporter (DMT)-like permease|nr:EamA family transporter [Rhodospirillales bacterium]